MKNKYDLIIIGSGPAGQKAALSMSKHGKSALIIENRPTLGGGCLHTGTIPSKTMREFAFSYKSRLIGYSQENKSPKEASIADLEYKMNDVINNEREIIHAQLTRNNVEIVFGLASFVDTNTIKVVDENGDTSKYQGANFLIATGSSPDRPENIPFDDKIICDSDTILQMEEIPKSIIIIGAGVIGSEYACIFSQMGVKVHLLNKYKDILNFVDKDVRRMLMEEMKAMGVMLHSEVQLDEIFITKENKACVKLNNGVELEAARVLYSQGRNGNTKKLNLENVGLKPVKYQLIEVDKKFKTKVDNIYACGDVIGYPSLASVSAEQGRLVANDILQNNSHAMSETYPYGIYTIPEISFVGKTEKQLQEQNIPYVTGIADYREIARGQIHGQRKGMLKMMIHCENADLLGVHIIGYGASELVHIGQSVLSYNGNIHYFIDNVFNYPTLAEAYKVAAINAYNKLPPSCKL